MENAAQLNSIASLEKKRKLQDSQLEMPSAKQVCREKVEGEEFAKGAESEPESTNSNSFHSNSADLFMCSDDEDKTDGKFHESGASDEPSTSSASWAGTSSGDSLYSSENRSSINSSTSEPESSSVSKHQDCPDDQCRQFAEFGCDGHAEIQLYTDKELEDLLYSNGASPGGSFILSSGRWSVGQGAKQEGKQKLTIDKEFEQYFSMLML
ncbi:protein FAR-RED-ELONGATED HYPOCOTYL 1-LIKE-like isoform X2 [Salvia miltiorrhiza]|uniref:protein FAR-RED-ELONGATED HYPOCOTYL 1-LIKE-like isoform X2 n=1 Tax=Salvia miltiorrhiza TaxID=226208 RepID=UPI0025AB84BC|nr:protein FAR-RED-ELONGATED HYPOCOTYL 1-LIKE-like isoform X2 [Salvia miltiorrhiza]